MNKVYWAAVVFDMSGKIHSYTEFGGDDFGYMHAKGWAVDQLTNNDGYTVTLCRVSDVCGLVPIRSITWESHND